MSDTKAAASAQAKDSCAKCKESVVKLSPSTALTLLIVNILWSGMGTMLSACMAKEGFQSNAFMYGICQWLTGGLLVGWIWSICHGCWLHKAAKGEPY